MRFDPNRWGRRKAEPKPRSTSSGEAGDAVPEQGHSQEDEDDRRYGAYVSLEPSPRRFEHPHRPIAGEHEHQERDAERKDGGEGEEHPIDGIASRARGELRDLR